MTKSIPPTTVIFKFSLRHNKVEETNSQLLLNMTNVFQWMNILQQKLKQFFEVEPCKKSFQIQPFEAAVFRDRRGMIYYSLASFKEENPFNFGFE